MGGSGGVGRKSAGISSTGDDTAATEALSLPVHQKGLACINFDTRNLTQTGTIQTCSKSLPVGCACLRSKADGANLT